MAVVPQLQDILRKAGNEFCADCSDPSFKNLCPEWASYNLGVFICTNCAGIHRKLGSHISKVKSIKLDRWAVDQMQRMEEVGNIKAREQYEKFVPLCYTKPTRLDAHVRREQWIRAKYEREEFIFVDRQIYTTGHADCVLMKRGKTEDKFLPRRFVLSETEGTVVYYVKENKDPKAVIRLSDLNVTFVPEKIGHPHGLQMSYLKDGSTRHLFVYAEDGKKSVDWYMSIRSAKLHLLQVAFPGTNEAEFASKLSRDFLKEGFLCKTGPRNSDGYKKRWFTLDDRKLMYMEYPLDAFPRGEIFVGYKGDNYKVLKGVPLGSKDQGYSFTLRTPDRAFLLSAENPHDRDEWIDALSKVIGRPMTPQDSSLAALLLQKRPTVASRLSIFRPI